MRIAVMGAGGLGGYFGARLAQGGHDVHFIARGAHLAAIDAAGLRVRSVRGDFGLPRARVDGFRSARVRPEEAFFDEI